MEVAIERPTKARVNNINEIVIIANLNNIYLLEYYRSFYNGVIYSCK